MGMEGVSDKVNINLGDGYGRGGGGDSLGGAGLAAVIAALGNRNEGGDTAGLIAALGNRNNDGLGGGGLAAMMAMNGNNGMNNMWPIILLALLGRGRGGLFGGGDGECGVPGGIGPGQAAILQTLLEGQSSLRAEVPTTALETQNAINSAIGSLALGTQQGFANTKDAVQNGISFLDRDIQMTNQNVSSQGCQTREAVQNDGDKTRALLVSRFQQEDATRIAALNAEVIELRNEGRRRADHDELRIQVSNTNVANATQTQAQAQFQVQAQFQDLNARLGRLFDRVDIVHQEQRSTNANIIAGNTGAVVTGPQTSTPTNVNAR